MFANGSMFDVFDGINVRYDSQAWLIQPISEESVSITEVYQVQEGLEILFKANGIWSVDNGLEGFDCTRKRDLVGAVFRVGAQEVRTDFLKPEGQDKIEIRTFLRLE